MIYLDYQATTPLAPEARAAMRPWLDDKFGNPHSPHRLGREAAAAVEAAREQVAALLPPAGRLAFTSGATEAINWAIKGTSGPIVTLATEHAAVLDTAGATNRPLTILSVGPDGLADLDEVQRALDAASGRGREPGVLTAMLVNNEIGAVQNIEELAEVAHIFGWAFLCDAVQGYGRLPIPDNCDFVAVSGHKIHGPKGVGALWLGKGMTLEPLLHGGGQESPGRSGTLSPMLCAGFGAAATLMADRRDEDVAHVERLWRRVLDSLGSGWTVNGSLEHRYRGNLNIRRDGLDAARLISEVREVAFSAGSACASGSGRPSHVLRAIGLSDAQVRSSIRLSFGRYTTEDEIDRAAALVNDAVGRQLRFAA